MQLLCTVPSQLQLQAVLQSPTQQELNALTSGVTWDPSLQVKSPAARCSPAPVGASVAFQLYLRPTTSVDLDFFANKTGTLCSCPAHAQILDRGRAWCLHNALNTQEQ